MKRQIAVLVGLGLIACGGGIACSAVEVTVPSTSGPWMWTNLYWQPDAVVNASYPYAEVIPEAFAPTTPPVVVSAINEIPFIPGDIITFNYLSGLVQGGWDFPWWDANGDTQDPPPYRLWNYGYFPGHYVPPVDNAPVYYMELIGVFTDSMGAIVGDPVVVGDSGSFSIPVGATRFQLGFNDCNYNDNSGSVVMGISEVPEPSSFILLGAGAIGLLTYTWRRRRYTI